jgi:hypothetical protein
VTREGNTILTRLFRIGLGAFALMLVAAPAHGWGSTGTALGEVAHAAQIVSSHIVGTLESIVAEFGLSEPVYRGTDRGEAIIILTLVCVSIVAFNLWFLRHLHCAYTPSQQGNRAPFNCGRRSSRARGRNGERFTRTALTSGTDAPRRHSAAPRARALRA